MPARIELSEATTGSILKPVMNLISSMAKTLVGIDHGDGERRAHAAERKNLVALRGLKRNQLDDCRINFKVRKIDGGNAVLAGEKIGDVLVREEAQLHQGGAQAAALLLLDLGRLFQLLWGNDLLFDEKVTQPLRHTPDLLSTWVERCRALVRHDANGRQSCGRECSSFALT